MKHLLKTALCLLLCALLSLPALAEVGEEMEELVYQKTGKKPSFVADVGCAVSINSGPKMIGVGFLWPKK